MFPVSVEGDKQVGGLELSGEESVDGFYCYQLFHTISFRRVVEVVAPLAVKGPPCTMALNLYRICAVKCVYAKYYGVVST